MESGNDSPFSTRLKEARERKSVSQKQLGISIGLDPSVASTRMNQYEKGRHEPGFSILKKLAAYLEVPTAYFYCEDDQLASLMVSYNNASKELRMQARNLFDH
ncbi:XRE family transcriptional regulator [Pelagibaculum spongiae]|uniref:XRE family transcriptional regulator n=1 Tax=Pelagibaculum spongiae TaxID=2080658 RepID=A0A2V1GYH8_9GAMM|nr:XRE family transcriptional regulator [Pelagibaculum spongiae]